jgi:DNA polymerase-3 subunit alpha
LFITGNFKQRYNTPEYEFKVISITTIENIKRNLTKQLSIEINPKNISDELISFVEGNVKGHPGRSSLKFNLHESKNNLKISLITMDTGFEMNDEMVEYLESHPDIEVQITSN